jgi:hypothetical protein
LAALIAADVGFALKIEVPQASIWLIGLTPVSRRLPVSSNPVQRTLALNRFFKGQDLKLVGMQNQLLYGFKQ